MILRQTLPNQAGAVILDTRNTTYYIRDNTHRRPWRNLKHRRSHLHARHDTHFTNNPDARIINWGDCMTHPQYVWGCGFREQRHILEEAQLLDGTITRTLCRTPAMIDTKSNAVDNLIAGNYISVWVNSKKTPCTACLKLVGENHDNQEDTAIIPAIRD